MNVFDVVKAIKSDIEEQFDFCVQNIGTELSWLDIEDIIREAADQSLDDQMIFTADIISLWQSGGMPESPTGEGDILNQMHDGLHEDILGDRVVGDMILDYVSDNMVHLCRSCAVAVVDNDFSSEGLTATPEQVSAFIGEKNPTYWVTYTELVSMCEICDRWGANRVFKVTPKGEHNGDF